MNLQFENHCIREEIKKQRFLRQSLADPSAECEKYMGIKWRPKPQRRESGTTVVAGC